MNPMQIETAKKRNKAAMEFFASIPREDLAKTETMEKAVKTMKEQGHTATANRLGVLRKLVAVGHTPAELTHDEALKLARKLPRKITGIPLKNAKMKTTHVFGDRKKRKKLKKVARLLTHSEKVANHLAGKAHKTNKERVEYRKQNPDFLVAPQPTPTEARVLTEKLAIVMASAGIDTLVIGPVLNRKPGEAVLVRASQRIDYDFPITLPAIVSPAKGVRGRRC